MSESVTISFHFHIPIPPSSLRDTLNPQITKMKREDVVYFGAGPASLPSDVLSTAAAALQNYEDTGL
jgi:hypothetical protein